MDSRLQITFLGIDPSLSLEDDIRARCEHVERIYGPLLSCHVTVAIPHRHHVKGNIFEVRIHATVVGAEIVVAHHDHASEHKDPYAAVQDAFVQAEKQLASRARKASRLRFAESF